MVLLSELGVKARGTQLLIEICKAMGASVFLPRTRPENISMPIFSRRKVLNFAASDMFRSFIRNFGETSFPIFPRLICCSIVDPRRVISCVVLAMETPEVAAHGGDTGRGS
jgi:hypothetical protein